MTLNDRKEEKGKEYRNRPIEKKGKGKERKEKG